MADFYTMAEFLAQRANDGVSFTQPDSFAVPVPLTRVVDENGWHFEPAAIRAEYLDIHPRAVAYREQLKAYLAEMQEG